MGKLNLCPSEHHSIKKKNNLQELQPQLFSIQPTHSQQKIQEYPFSFPQNKPKDFTTPIRPSHRKSSKTKKNSNSPNWTTQNFTKSESPKIWRNPFGFQKILFTKWPKSKYPFCFLQKNLKTKLRNSQHLQPKKNPRISKTNTHSASTKKKKKSKTPNLFSVQTIPENSLKWKGEQSN